MTMENNKFVTVYRRDFDARTFKNKTRPAYYVCKYYYAGKEIASYNSLEDLLRLRTEFIKNDFSMPVYDRALNGLFSNGYRYLFSMLGCDEKTNMSEYMYGI